MANIDIENSEKMGEEELEQVKGGPAYIKLGDIKGESEVTGFGMKSGYDLKKGAKV